MQAANLLAVIAPVNPGKGAPAGLSAPAEGETADVQGQGADAANPFAQALAALMAAPGQLQAQNPVAPGPKGEDTAAAQGQDARSQGLQTALAAVTANGAAAKGLIRLTTPPATDIAATTPDAGAEAPEMPVAAAPAPAPLLPDTVLANEAMPAVPASPAPSAEPTQPTAEGAQLTQSAAAPLAPTAEALPPASVDPAAAPAIPAGPALAEAAAPPAPPLETVAAETVVPPASGAGETLAAAETSPATTPPAPPRADGKALGKTEPKRGKSALAPGQTASGHGRGLANAPGQVKKAAAEDAAADAGLETDVEAAASQAPEHNTDAPGALVAEQARAMPTPAHGDGARLAAHTVAHLASQIVAKADGKATRFDVQLDPAGLGKVDVKIEISRGGEISAALSFDNPQAAAEMRSRAGELRQALEQAGFDLSKGGLSFDLNSQNPGRQPFDQQPDAPRPAWARGAFTDLAASPEAAAPALRRLIAAGGVDVTI